VRYANIAGSWSFSGIEILDKPQGLCFMKQNFLVFGRRQSTPYDLDPILRDDPHGSSLHVVSSYGYGAAQRLFGFIPPALFPSARTAPFDRTRPRIPLGLRPFAGFDSWR
jgi:hypothetical protein